jgi:hypothetical protein
MDSNCFVLLIYYTTFYTSGSNEKGKVKTLPWKRLAGVIGLLFGGFGSLGLFFFVGETVKALQTVDGGIHLFVNLDHCPGQAD